MDFLDPAKRRQHKIRLTIGYCLVAIALGFITYLLWLLSFGYGFDPKTGQVIQNGLVYVSSQPSSAEVYANNKFRGKSNLKLTIPGGNYDFVLKSKGYRDWSTSINLPGGGVVRLTYPLLIPEKLVTSDVQIYDKPPALASLSPDRRWLVVLRPDSSGDFDVYDLRQKNPQAVRISLPAAEHNRAPGSHKYKAIEWASNNRHLLLEHTYKGGKEFVVLDRQDPRLSYNVNDLLDASPDSVVFHDKRFDRLYAYNAKNKTLLEVNARNNQVATLLNEVLSYKAYGSNTVLYTSAKSKTKGNYSVNIWDGRASRLLHEYTADTAYKLDIAGFGDDLYVAVSPVSTNRLYVFKNPLSIMRSNRIPNPFIAIRINNPQFVSFSTSGQFIMAQSGSSFASYDFDIDAWYYFTLKDKLPLTAKAEWMDGNRMTLNINNKLAVFDFNGDNQQYLSVSSAGMNAYFDGNYDNLYTLGPSIKQPTKAALTRTLMVVP